MILVCCRGAASARANCLHLRVAPRALDAPNCATLDSKIAMEWEHTLNSRAFAMVKMVLKRGSVSRRLVQSTLIQQGLGVQRMAVK